MCKREAKKKKSKKKEFFKPLTCITVSRPRFMYFLELIRERQGACVDQILLRTVVPTVTPKYIEPDPTNTLQ